MADLLGETPKPIQLTADEIEAGKTPKGAWTRKTLAGWGVSWPPPKGWRRALLAGCSIDELPPEPEPKEQPEPESYPDCFEAKLLHQVVMALITTGQSDLLKGIDDANAYYNCKIPIVSEIVGGRPETAIINGGIEWDDKVYRFSIGRIVKLRSERA